MLYWSAPEIEKSFLVIFNQSQRVNSTLKSWFDYVIHGLVPVSPLSNGNRIQKFKTSNPNLDKYLKARALLDFEAEFPSDLTLRTGDVIYIVYGEEQNEGWTGIVGDRQGLFPSECVELVEEIRWPMHRNEPTYVLATIRNFSN